MRLPHGEVKASIYGNCDGFTSVGVVFDDATITVACHGSSQAEDCFRLDRHDYSQLDSQISQLSNTATEFSFIS